MKKIYLVTSGSYSDYSVVSAFSSKEKAENYIIFVQSLCSREWPMYDINKDVEEIDLDREFNIDDFVEIPLWTVRIKKNGTIEAVFQKQKLSPKLFSTNITDYSYMKVFTIQAKDEETAIKIAGDLRTQLLVTDKWD